MDEPTLRRRDFLARTAAAAGLPGLSSLPAGTLLAEAATSQRRALPSPRNLPIDHIVVVMMENCPFDHYFGWLEGADGDQTQTYADATTGKRVRTRHASSLEAEWQGCGHPDPDPGHGWEQGRAQLNGGFLAEGSGYDESPWPGLDGRRRARLRAVAVLPTGRAVRGLWRVGGFFDHVRSPRVRDARAATDATEDFGQMGFRIPAVAVSPYARRRPGRDTRVRHATLGFESIIKFVTHRFGLGSLTVRDHYATNIGETFDWAHPRFEAPDLPDPKHVASRPCVLGGGDVLIDESAAAHVSDLAALEDLADRFGVPAGDGKVADLFSKPDAIRRAARRGALDGALARGVSTGGVGLP